jgi:Contact-dependent growth inhibition CdiA C-terminal domain
MSQTDSDAPRPLEPSLTPNLSNKPRGYPTEVNPNPQTYQEREQARAHRRENESAEILAKAGYDVEQNPPPREDGKKPDYRIEGNYVDCMAPITGKVENIYREIERKVFRGQVDRVVVNMEDTPVSPEALEQILGEYSISGLKEVITIKGGQIVASVISLS